MLHLKPALLRHLAPDPALIGPGDIDVLLGVLEEPDERFSRARIDEATVARVRLVPPGP
jgi:penicillin amidase